MCCFAQDVRAVHGTRIFSRLTEKGTQFLAYQMKYESDVPNAMILPLPIKTPAGEDSVSFIDLSGYTDFFRHLARGFPRAARPSIGCAASPTDSIASRSLSVHQVGDFVASFVPTVDDFARLDPQFVIPKETWSKIPRYADFGFAVFQLQQLAGEPHPMAFEFETRTTETFFPTLHIHDGEIHEAEDFDHVLYLQHAGFDSIVGSYQNHDIRDSATGLVRSRHPAAEFCSIEKSKGLIAPDLLVHKFVIRGSNENKDFTYFAKGSALVPRLNLRQWSRLWPWSIVGVGAAWFLRRRGMLRASRQSSPST